MSLQKILFISVFTATTFSISNAMAGVRLPDPWAPAVPKTTNNYFYLEGNVGYARQNYFSNENYYALPPITPPQPGVDLNNNNNAHGGFSGGVDAGYVFNSYFAVELGWFYLPSVNVMSAGSPTGYLKSWLLYLAGKYMMPIPLMHHIDAFFKLGVEYRKTTLPDVVTAVSTGYGLSTGKSTYLRPMFATGLDYHFNDTWMGIIQYAYFMGANNSFPSSTPNSGSLGTVAANVFTLGLGYQFTV